MAGSARAVAIPHGGSLAEAARCFPDAQRPLIDLSTGINPRSYPVPPLPLEIFTRLPEPGALRRLEAIAATAYGVPDASMVVAAPGTQILISLLPRLFPQVEIGILGQTYAEHEASWAGLGVRVHHATDLRECEGLPAAVLCNPNNPDGRRVDPALIAMVAEKMSLLVVDEAFADLEPSPISAARFLGAPGLVILRSFGKSYGLAGIRLGFALAAREKAAAFRAALGPWAVSGAAIEVASRALADESWRRTAAIDLDAAVLRLDRALLKAGFATPIGTRLFRLVEADDALRRFDVLGRAGVFVRRFPDRPRFLRFGIPAEGDWARVEQALEACARC
jgi:cobalamin biosynthetic protein CobC